MRRQDVAATAVGAVAPVNTVAPVASGAVSIGGTLSCTTGTWTGIPTPTFTYQWRRDGVNIASATNSTYTPVAADLTPTADGQAVGPAITCRVTATSVAGVVTADSNTLNYAPTTSLTTRLKGWWRGDLGYSAGTLLDKSGGTFDLTQATAGRRPGTRTVNGKTALDFDGTDDRLASSVDVNTVMGAVGHFEAWVVFNADALAAVTGFNTPNLMGQDTNNNWNLGAGSAALYADVVDNGSITRAANTANAPATGTTYRARMFWDGTNLNVKLGSGATAQTAAASLLAALFTGNKLLLGWNASQNAFFDGAWCEGFLIAGDMTASERADLDAWCLRWGAQV